MKVNNLIKHKLNSSCKIKKLYIYIFLKNFKKILILLQVERIGKHFLHFLLKIVFFVCFLR